MFVYLQAYEQGAVPLRPLVAFVTFYRAQKKAFETSPEQVANASNSRLNTLPLRFDVLLNHLPPGEYECQVTVLDPGGEKGTFWRAPIVVLE